MVFGKGDKMSIPRSYKLPFEQYCIGQEKIKNFNVYMRICNDCGICYTSFHENCDIAIFLEKYYEKEQKEINDYLTSTK